MDILVGLGIAAAVVLLGVLAGVSLSYDRMRERDVARLSGLFCPQCAAAVSRATAEAARSVWETAMRAAHARAQDDVWKVQLDPRWRFCCASCRSRLAFDASSGALELVSVRTPIEDLIELLANFAGPLGPSGTVDVEDAAFRAGLDRMTAEDLDRLVSLLTDPPVEAVHPAVRDSWEYALMEALSQLGRRFPARALSVLRPVLTNEGPARRAAITVVGAVGGPGGVALLDELAMCSELDAETREVLAEAQRSARQP